MRYRLLILFMIGYISMYAQSNTESSLITSTEALKTYIANNPKYSKALCDSLKKTIELQDSLLGIYQMSIKELGMKVVEYSENQKRMNILYDTTTAVFDETYPLPNFESVPKCFRTNYTAICLIREFEKATILLEKKVDKSVVDAEGLTEKEIKSFVSKKIEKDLTNIEILSDKINQNGIDYLSAEQQEYYNKNLINRVNKILSNYIFE